MRCPRCNSQLPDTAQDCPKCGQNLEVSYSSLDELWDDGSYTGEPSQIEIQANQGQSQVEVFTSAAATSDHSAIEQAAPPPPPPPVAQPAAQPAEQPAGREQFGGGLQANINTRIVETDPEKNRHTRIIDVSVPAVVRRAQQDAPAAGMPAPRQGSTPQAKSDEPIDALGEGIRLFYNRMHRVDRIGFWVTVLTFFSAFLPWRYVLGEGLISGIEGLGAATAGAALLVGLCIYTRTARRRLSGLVLVGQLVAAAGVAAVPVYQFFYQQGLGFHVGLYSTAVGGAALIVLTFARMAVRSF